MTKTMKIKELVSKLKLHDGKSTVKVWSKGADKAYPISYLFIGSINEEDFVYINIDDRNLVDLSKVWHDAKEEPEKGKLMIGIDEDGVSAYNWVGQDECGWLSFAEFNGLIRWAYVSDILPKGGEG